MNPFDNLISRNLGSSFNDWHDALIRYEDIDGASYALYEAARRSPQMHVGLAYGALTHLLAQFFDQMQARPDYETDDGKLALAGYVYRTFRLLSAMDASQPERDLSFTHAVRDDIVAFLNSIILSLR